MKTHRWVTGKLRRAAKLAALLSAVVTISASLTGCRGRASGNEERYDLKGVVVNVDKRGSTVTIAHHEIAGYMDAMTMPFKLKDEWAFDVLAPGNRVQATLVVDGLRSWLENIVVIEDAVDSAASATSSIGPAPGAEMPDFTLTNQDGKRIKLRSFRGRALVLTFIYTRCPLPEYCPLVTTNFEQIAKALKQDSALRAKAHLLSISVDPAHDTPEVLRQYGAAHTGEQGAQTFSQWEFATGSADEVKKVATYFGLQYWKDKDSDQIVHSLVSAVISPEGKIAKIYPGNEWQPDEIVTLLGNLKQVQLDAKRQQEKAAKIYHGVGVVESVNDERTTVQINHEDIKDLMPAMNMPFEVKDKSLLNQIAPGDRVTFGLQDMPHGLVVVEIKKQQ